MNKELQLLINDKNKVHLLEKAYVIICLIISTEAIIPLYYNNGIISAAQNANYIQPIILGFYLAPLIYFILNINYLINSLIKNIALVAILMLVFSSFLWSVNDTATINTSIHLLSNFIFVIYLHKRFKWTEIFNLVLITLTICTILSCYYSIFIPSLGLHHDDFKGVWRGIYVQKNILGRVMLLSTILWVVRFVYSKKNRTWSLLFTLLSFIVLLLSHSGTSLLILMFLLMLLPLYKFSSINQNLRTAIIFLSVGSITLISAFCYFNLSEVYKFIGKDPTLTGRTYLWDLVWQAIHKQPWLGYGFNAFWSGMEGPSRFIWIATGTEPKFSHSGYLDIILQIGYGGSIVLGLLMIRMLYLSILYMKVRKNIISIVPFCFIVFTLAYNLSESTLLKSDSLFWLLFMLFSIEVVNLNKQQTDYLLTSKERMYI